MAEFFRVGGPRLALFLNAGDPPLDHLPDLVSMLDESDVDVLELAVPFPHSVTDGPVIRASADRALRRGTDLPAVLKALAALQTRRLKIVLLADWSHTVRVSGVDDFLGRSRDHGVDGVLVHGLPPRLRSRYHDAADAASMPIVTTCYPNSPDAVLAESARRATAYLYLVAHYGRTGQSRGFAHLPATIGRLRPTTTAPIAVGFGVRSRADVEAVHAAGADAAIVGSAAVAEVERADGLDPVNRLRDLVAGLRAPASHHQAALAAARKETRP